MTTRRSELMRRLAEALTITASILLAFGIDAWWDGIQERKLDRTHLESVLRELETTADLLDDAIRLHSLSEVQAIAVLEMTSSGKLPESPPSLDSLIDSLLNSYVINAPTGALQAAILSGSIARIDDDELKSTLLGWEGQIQELLEEEMNGSMNALAFLRWLGTRVSLHGPLSNLDRRVSGESTEVTDRTLPRSRHSPSVESLIDDVEFENQILSLHAHARFSHDEAQAFRKILNDAITRLKTYLYESWGQSWGQ